jgi:hypothetical protein
MPKEKSHLVIGEAEELGGKELLSAALAKETQLVKPFSYRIPASTGESIRGRKIKVPPGLLSNQATRDTEALGSLGDCLEILGVLIRVVEGLTFDEAAITNEVSEKDHLGILPTPRVGAFSQSARHRQVLTQRQVGQRFPSIEGKEWMVGACTNLSAGSELQLEGFLYPARKHFRHCASNELEVIVQSPNRDVSLLPLVELANRNRFTGVGTDDPRIRREAPRFA